MGPSKTMRVQMIIALVAGFGLSACQNSRPGLYAWAGYEESVWSLTHGEGAADVDAQIDQLNQTIERAREKGVRVAPGMHAHVGYLYSLRGEVDTAQAAFETERELYPESKTFIDGIIARMGENR